MPPATIWANPNWTARRETCHSPKPTPSSPPMSPRTPPANGLPNKPATNNHPKQRHRHQGAYTTPAIRSSAMVDTAWTTAGDRAPASTALAMPRRAASATSAGTPSSREPMAVLVENVAIRFDLGDRESDDRRSCLFVWSTGSSVRCCPGLPCSPGRQRRRTPRSSPCAEVAVLRRRKSWPVLHHER
jgi:hypothetical protein